MALQESLRDEYERMCYAVEQALEQIDPSGYLRIGRERAMPGESVE